MCFARKTSEVPWYSWLAVHCTFLLWSSMEFKVNFLCLSGSTTMRFLVETYKHTNSLKRNQWHCPPPLAVCTEIYTADCLTSISCDQTLFILTLAEINLLIKRTVAITSIYLFSQCHLSCVCVCVTITQPTNYNVVKMHATATTASHQWPNY